MGGVELLSREGEIAIAKRIEAGKDVMINALTQSPLVAKKIYEWKEKLEKNELLVRDIIDIDSTYEDFEESENQNDEKTVKEVKSKKNTDEDEKKTEEVSTEDDEFNVSLAKMEEEIKPKIVNIIDVQGYKYDSSNDHKHPTLYFYGVKKY